MRLYAAASSGGVLSTTMSRSSGFVAMVFSASMAFSLAPPPCLRGVRGAGLGSTRVVGGAHSLARFAGLKAPLWRRRLACSA